MAKAVVSVSTGAKQFYANAWWDQRFTPRASAFRARVVSRYVLPMNKANMMTPREMLTSIRSRTIIRREVQ